MRDQTQNSFNDGLNTDLNAMVTPNTVMTDCLNGTLITYNGNEFVLQNDMGNGKVESAYLPTGFVPVGMKENGGIIYVASYNPLTKESQLGSFPSPERNLENTDYPKDKQNTIEFPTDIIADVSQKIFIEEQSLKPGNKFCIGLPGVPITEITPNFNDEKGTIYNGQNKRYNVTLNMINSDGILVDITSSCIPIKDPITNNYYFFTTTEYSDSNNNSKKVYNDNLTSYSDKSSGTPFIKVVTNKVNTWDVVVTPGKDKLESPTQVTLDFNISYEYNGPVYKYKESEEGLAGFKFSYTVNTEKQTPIEILFNEMNDLFESTKNPGLYTITFNSKIIETFNQDDFISYEITPIYRYKVANVYKNLISNNLSYSSNIEVRKIYSDYNEINTWRYFVDDKYLTLTWGMDSYPISATSAPTDLKFEFFDIASNDFNNPNFTLKDKSLEKSNYNGMFTELIKLEESSFINNAENTRYTSLEFRKVYLVKITWNVISTNPAMNGEHESWRYVITTPIDNVYYWNVQDFIKLSEKVNQNDKSHIRNVVIYPELAVDGNKRYTPPLNSGLEYISDKVGTENIDIEDTYEYNFKLNHYVSTPNALPFQASINNEPNLTINSIECTEKEEDIVRNTPIIKNTEVTFKYSVPFSYKFDDTVKIRVNELFTTYSARDFSIDTLGSNFPCINIYTDGEHHGWLSGEDDHWIKCLMWGWQSGTKNASNASVNEHLDDRCTDSTVTWNFNDYLEQLFDKYVTKIAKYPLVCGILYFDRVKDPKKALYNYLVYDGSSYIFAYKSGKSASGYNTNNQEICYNFGSASTKNPYDPTNGYLKDTAICLGNGNISNKAAAVLDPDNSKKIQASSVTEKLNFNVDYVMQIQYEGDNSNSGYNKVVRDAIAKTGLSQDSVIYEDLLDNLQFRLLSNNNGTYSKTLDNYPDSFVNIQDTLSGEVVNDVTGNEDAYEEIKNAAGAGIPQAICYKHGGSLKYTKSPIELDINLPYRITLNSSGEIADIKTDEDVTIGTLTESQALSSRHAFLIAKTMHQDIYDNDHDTLLKFGSTKSAGLI